MDIGNGGREREREQAHTYTKFNGIHQKVVHNLMLVVPQTKERTSERTNKRQDEDDSDAAATASANEKWKNFFV